MNWLDPKQRHDFAQIAAQSALIATQANRQAVVDYLVDQALRTESPLEARFTTVFAAARNHLLAQGHARYALRLTPQVWVSTPTTRYRLDFIVEPMDDWLRAGLLAASLTLRIGIELDGHDFHERTRDQVTDRNQRDRDLAALGWRVFHVSGSEFLHQPVTVVVEIFEAAVLALDAAKAALVFSQTPCTPPSKRNASRG